MSKETVKERRNRMANELMDAYNNGGDYQAVIAQIEACGDTFRGWMEIKAEGIITEDSFLVTYNTASVKIFRTLPQKPQKGWTAILTMIEVFYDGANVPPKCDGRTTFRKDIWR